MKKIIILTMFLCMFCSLVKAEIKQVLDDFPPISLGESRRPRNIKGTFEFVNLPEPLKVSTVNYTLEVSELPGFILNSDEDWTIGVSVSDNNIEMITDSTITWPAPHKIGDIFTGTIECRPLSSGLQGFMLSIRNIANDFSIQWVFDENGNLLALDNRYININDYNFLYTYFFDEDSIYLNSNHKTYKTPLKHEITIKPIPKIGDTSTVHIRLIAKTGFSNGLDLDLQSNHLNVITQPSFVKYPVYKNQVVDLNFNIVPDSFNYRHGFAMTIYNDITDSHDHQHRYRFSVDFIFNEDGSLKFVNDRGFYADKAKKYHLKSFKNPINSGQKNVKILKNGKIINLE